MGIASYSTGVNNDIHYYSYNISIPVCLILYIPSIALNTYHSKYASMNIAPGNFLSEKTETRDNLLFIS